PQSDTFTLAEAAVNVVLKPISKSYLFADFFGSHQHFWKFDKADRTFLDLALDYQYFVTPSFGMGLSNILSHSDLKLFDTEGNTLPRDKFGSLSERVRLYGLYYPSQSVDLELGSAYRIMDTEETQDFTSLDFKEISADFASRYFFSPTLSTRLKYEYSVLSYDELQALNRDTSFNNIVDPANPRLRMRRHDISSSLKYKKNIDVDLTGKLRINDDRFQDDLSYRQGEIKARAVMGDLNILNLSVEIYYKNRYYTDRRKGTGSEENLKEEFLIGSTSVTRNLTKWLQAYLRYQWIHKTSNASTSEFNDHSSILGLRVIL
ncbi:MAG: hypothetical protein L0Y56_18585, partial [Nitrospira sp.]|nr:hypothetical protein [Nitrospira sp.]